jgi:hypothetical protein
MNTGHAWQHTLKNKPKASLHEGFPPKKNKEWLRIRQLLLLEATFRCLLSGSWLAARSSNLKLLIYTLNAFFRAPYLE